MAVWLGCQRPRYKICFLDSQVQPHALIIGQNFNCHQTVTDAFEKSVRTTQHGIRSFHYTGTNLWNSQAINYYQANYSIF